MKKRSNSIACKLLPTFHKRWSLRRRSSTGGISITKSECNMEEFVLDLYTVGFKKLDCKNQKPKDAFTTWYCAGPVAPESECPSPTISELNMEQFIFDLYLNSPTKKRRQSKAAAAHDRNEINPILSPTEMEKNMEQVVLDIYLNSPTKERRQLQAAEMWEKAREEKKRNTVRTVSCLGPRQMFCRFEPSPILRREILDDKELNEEMHQPRRATV